MGSGQQAADNIGLVWATGSTQLLPVARSPLPAQIA